MCGIVVHRGECHSHFPICQSEESTCSTLPTSNKMNPKRLYKQHCGELFCDETITRMPLFHLVSKPLQCPLEYCFI